MIRSFLVPVSRQTNIGTLKNYLLSTLKDSPEGERRWSDARPRPAKFARLLTSDLNGRSKYR